MVELNQGDRVPADCILLEETKMKVDQSMYSPNPKDPVFRVMGAESVKETSKIILETDKAGNVVSEGDNHHTHPDPFLFSDSKVLTGQGKALVCQVGDNTLLAKTRKPEDYELKEEYTFLE